MFDLDFGGALILAVLGEDGGRWEKVRVESTILAHHYLLPAVPT